MIYLFIYFYKKYKLHLEKLQGQSKPFWQSCNSDLTLYEVYSIMSTLLLFALSCVK